MAHLKASAFLALALLVSGAGAGLAQPAPASQQAAPSPGDEQVIVVGQRTREAVRAFVGQMAMAPPGPNQLGRWDASICLGLAGLKTRYAQFIIDRIAQRAEAVGLDIGEPGCRPNVLIVISPEPDAIAHELVDGHEGRMGVLYQRGRNSMGRRALGAFVTSTAPVRWWHVSHTTTADGDPIGETSDGGPSVELLSGGSTRIHRTSHQNLGAAYIIVDARRLQGVSFEALADYLAMVSLAELDPNGDTSAYPTILNLFRTSDAQSRPTAMTDWDTAYLHGLYDATRDARNAQTQEGEIQHSMTGDVTRH